MGGRVRLVGVVTGAVALCLSWGAVQAAGATPEQSVTAGHLTLVGHGDRYMAQLSDPQAGVKVSFALVGEGVLTGPAVCVTPASGRCEVTVSGVGTDGATLAAQAAGDTAVLTIGGS